jgi:hypothetical protein
MDYAALGGYVIEWLHEVVLPKQWMAPLYGYLEIIQWLHENIGRLPREAMNDAAGNGPQPRTNSAGDNTVRVKVVILPQWTGQQEVDILMVKWLHHNRSEGCTKSAMAVS